MSTSAIDRGKANVERKVRVVSSLRESSILVALVLLVAVVTAIQPRFLSFENITQILLSVSIAVILVSAQTLVIITGNIDLSVGSIVGVSALVAADLLAHGVTIPIAIILAILCGAVGGALNGLLVSYLRVPSIVATLGTLAIFRGVAFLIAQGRQLSASDVPTTYLQLTAGSVFGVPYLLIYAAVVAAVLSIVLRTTLTGRRVYAIGSRPATADEVGIPRKRILFWVYVIAGLLAGIGGVLWGSRFATVDANAASGIELGIVAAAVVGGVNIFGGSGTILGAALGALLLGTINNALAVLNLDQNWLQAIQGFVILVAVIADARIKASLARILNTSGR
ncbi:ABC transporter permease [uncultured Leifsonia sp.]|uniref:ABC transporter permease n=1 Tax=uncultured Leifsonia sp. TaxID=340359 RepID=UPI0025D9B9C2|nr:ABC transporter permease [uncultured Leifsonia sp.]